MLVADGANRAATSSRMLLLVAFILLLIGASWVGVLDKASDEYVDKALAKSVIAFGTARAINGAISVAQSTTVTVGVGAGAEISPGEILDPINDLVEDYSSAMKLAIVSLVIQKTLLAVVSETVFKVLLTVSGIALLASLMLNLPAVVSLMFKVFVSLAFLRFILVAVVLINGLVNQAFIDERRDEAMERLDVLPAALEQGVVAGASVGESAAREAELARLQKDIGTARSDLKNARARLEKANTNRSMADTLLPFRNEPARDTAVAGVKRGEARLDSLLLEQCKILRLIEDPGADAACDELPAAMKVQMLVTSAGKAISDVARSATSAFDVAKLKQRVEAAVEDMVTSMALFILQTLILPLVFLFAISKAMKSVWGLDLKELTARTKAIASQGTAGRGLGAR